MSPGRKIPRRRGFTLIEVMIAMTVLGLSLASSMIAITLGFRILEDARMGTLASQVLQSEMETLRLKNWAEIDALAESSPFTVDTTLASAAFNRFTCTRTVQPAFTEMKLVTLTVDWTSTSGQPKRCRYYTLISKGGLNDYFYRKS